MYIEQAFAAISFSIIIRITYIEEILATALRSLLTCELVINLFVQVPLILLNFQLTFV
jgi:hypothetical protein